MFRVILPKHWSYGGGCIRPPRDGARGRFVTLELGDVHVVEYGEPDGQDTGNTKETVVCIHGFLGSCRFWSESSCSHCALAPFLAYCGFHVVTYDLWGYGYSDAPDPSEHKYTQDFYVAQFVDLLDAMGLREVHIVAHSLGGAIGMSVSMEVPERVKNVVLHAPALHSPMFGLLAQLYQRVPTLVRAFAAVSFYELVGDVNDRNPAALRTSRAVIEGRAVTREHVHKIFSGLPIALGNSGPSVMTPEQANLQDRLTILVPNQDELVPFTSTLQFREVCVPRAVLHILDGARHPALAAVGTPVNRQVLALVEAALRGTREWVSTYHVPTCVPHGCNWTDEQIFEVLVELGCTSGDMPTFSLHDARIEARMQRLLCVSRLLVGLGVGMIMQCCVFFVLRDRLMLKVSLFWLVLDLVLLVVVTIETKRKIVLDQLCAKPMAVRTPRSRHMTFLDFRSFMTDVPWQARTSTATEHSSRKSPANGGRGSNASEGSTSSASIGVLELGTCSKSGATKLLPGGTP